MIETVKTVLAFKIAYDEWVKGGRLGACGRGEDRD